MAGLLQAEGPAEKSGYLTQAETLAESFCSKLRDLLEAATRQRNALEAELRQLARLRDEVEVRLRFAREGNAPADPQLQEKRDALWANEQRIRQALAEAEEHTRRLELLLRHVQMSARSLRSSPAGQPYDPWEMALRSQALYGREAERNALAREVHDGPAQLLASLALGLEQLRGHLSPQEVAREGLERLLRDVRWGLQEARRLIYELRPSPFSGETLGKQVERYVHDLEAAYGIAVELRWADAPRELTQEEKVAVYRIVQEALRNAHRHARASRIAVEAFAAPTGWTVRVVDDGIGFDPDLLGQQQDHWGIRGMRERAQLIGAQLRIESRRGEGTAVVLHLPEVPGSTERG